MCGIFGIFSNQKNNTDPRDLKEGIKHLFALSESRGKEASGLLTIEPGSVEIFKSPQPSHVFIRSQQFTQLFDRMVGESWMGCIGHSRLATNGLQTTNSNNQPVVAGSVVGVHNGIVVNDQEIWSKALRKKGRSELDTRAFFGLIQQEHTTQPLAVAVQRSYAQIEGSASIAVISDREERCVLATNTGSLNLGQDQASGLFVFASERYIVEQLMQRWQSAASLQITHLRAGTGSILDFTSHELDFFTLVDAPKRRRTTAPQKKKRYFIIQDTLSQSVSASQEVLQLYGVKNSVSKLRRHDFPYDEIYALNRCTKCLLPETAPFLNFDTQGVCSYCRGYKKITHQGKEALEKELAKYRSADGSPDCLVAFSGGRDSAYALHFLKEEMGMHPIAYTYDWGMVTDVARQNQARIVGKLGIEHVIVSADITMKRDHIRKHITAWMKQPDLGMVPLFMEGDKQCEYYADQLMEKTGIQLMFFARGNEFENEEFKWGHCGITNGSPNGVIHHLSLQGKLQLMAYYARQFVTNPAYINSSLFDTMFAYYSTYIQQHSYLYLWHYIPWNEEEIISTLIEKYGWRTEHASIQTWRTDDGTSAFYNYIYYMGQGYTENDTFRSNQIREGILTRDEAWKLVCQENKPRHKALAWYFDRVGLDGDKVLSVVDGMRRLY